MWVSKIRKLIKLVEESDIGELEISGWGQKVRISKKPRGSGTVAPENPTTDITVEPKAEPAAVAPQPAPVGEPEKATVEETDHLVPVKSPMVGTFYRAPAPDAKPYVE